MVEMKIVRRAKPEDAVGIHIAHMHSIRELCSKEHSPEEIQGWGNRPYNEQKWINAIVNQFVWVVDNSGKIEGYGHLSITAVEGVTKGHVLGLYLVPEATGEGVGFAIAKEIIATAKHQNATEINLESTLTAHSFYKKIGFIESGVLSTIEIGGTKIRYIPMKMVL